MYGFLQSIRPPSLPLLLYIAMYSIVFHTLDVITCCCVDACADDTALHSSCSAAGGTAFAAKLRAAVSSMH